MRRLAARARTLAVLYLLVLFVATHIPLHAVARMPASDKFMHTIAYALLTFAVLTGWELTTGVLQAKHYFAVWLVGTVYGAFDEVTQIPVGRFADMNDWLADVVGILVGLTVFRLSRVWIYRIFVPDSPLAAWK